MKPLNWDELISNREKLIKWQSINWYIPTFYKNRLHLGCGDNILPYAINIDLYNPSADMQLDIRTLDGIENDSTSGIISHHALEHLGVREMVQALNRWYEVLEPGGTLELGLPDVELCMKMFLESPEDKKYNWDIYTMYGYQKETSENDKSEGQYHKSGVSLGKLVRILEDIGFLMDDAYNYDGYGTPSSFVLAHKPVKPMNEPCVLEKDIVMGTFTNTTEFLPSLWKSAHHYLPNIPFITHIEDKPIVTNMNLLRDIFVKTGKRYWLFLDHDIQFLNEDIVKNALNVMINNNAGAVTCYMDGRISSPALAYNTSELLEHKTTWATGYFILVDSYKVGYIKAREDLPDLNTAIDISYSLDIIKEGFEIWVVPDYVYHTRKYTPLNVAAFEVTQKFMTKEYGKLYLSCQHPINLVIA